MTTTTSAAPVASGPTPPPRPPSPTRRHFWAEAEAGAPPEAVWAVWTDLDVWPSIDPALRSVELAGGARTIAAVGQEGTLVDETGRPIAWSVTYLDPLRAYTFTSRLPLARLHVHRRLNPTDSGRLRLTHEVWFGGPLGAIFGLLLGRRFASLLPGVVARVVELAESKAA